MMLTILRVLSLIPTALMLRSELALENLVLRQQLAVLHRQHRRPKLRRSDRIFWLLVSRFWVRWKETLVIVKPETVLRWQRKRFASYLRRIVRSYVSCYHGSRTHLVLEKDAPEPRSVQPPRAGTVIEISEVGGLHHRDERRAA
jgi:hypothetical protein